MLVLSQYFLNPPFIRGISCSNGLLHMYRSLQTVLPSFQTSMRILLALVVAREQHPKVGNDLGVDR